MKKITKYIGLSMVFSGLHHVATLDVQSKGQLTDDEMFTDLTGYEDAMFGIYGKLASSNLYGSNLHGVW